MREGPAPVSEGLESMSKPDQFRRTPNTHHQKLLHNTNTHHLETVQANGWSTRELNSSRTEDDRTAEKSPKRR
jgi:hypothetical protein